MTGYVYFVQNPKNLQIKIGKTINPYKRMHELNFDAGTKLKLIGVMYSVAPLVEEAKLLHRFSGFRVHGDWFDGTIIKYLKPYKTRFLKGLPPDTRLNKGKRQRLVLPLPKSLVDKIDTAAKAERRSFNSMFAEIVRNWIAENDD